MTSVIFGKKEFLVVGAIALAIALSAAQASAATLAAFTGIASGTSGGEFSCNHAANPRCPGSDTCTCVPFTGTGKASVIGALTFSTTVVIDIPVGDCDQTFGTVTLTSKGTSANKLVLDYTGLVCSGFNGSDSFALNASYVVDGKDSTGKFAGASGSGNIAGAEDFTTGSLTGNVNGDLLP